jgi:hypothetical protein
MSATVVNSSILLALTIVVGFASLAVQTLFWPKAAGSGMIGGTIKALGEIWKEIIESITIWDPSNMDFKPTTFARMSVTFVLMAGLLVVVLATYDSVSSFWVYFVLYLGVAILAVPILGHLIYYFFFRKERKPMTNDMMNM